MLHVHCALSPLSKPLHNAYQKPHEGKRSYYRNHFASYFPVGHPKGWCLNQLSSVQSLSRVWLFVTPWIAARQASLSITNSRSLLKLMSIKLVMPSTHLILCRPLLPLSPIPPSIRVFSNESTLHEGAKVLEFQLQHQSFQWTPRIDLL